MQARYVGLTFSYDNDHVPIHAVRNTSAGGVFTYDAAGNMVSRKTYSAAPTQTLAWSPANELLSVTTGATVESYRYDADGQRIYQESKTGGNLTWRHFDYFPHYTVGITATQTVTKTYFFAGQPLAQRVNSGAVTYLHTDHLGSTVLMTGAGGSQRYNAYGSTRSGAVPTKYQYTGHEADSGTGLIYMKARYYDPVIGQFVSPDTIVPDLANVYAYNRYMYAYGNPLKYNDPTGHQASCTMDQNLNWLCTDNAVTGGVTLELDPDGEGTANNGSTENFLRLMGSLAAIAVTPATLVASGVVAGSTAVGVGEVACADGNCTNEVQAGAEAVQEAGRLLNSSAGQATIRWMENTSTVNHVFQEKHAWDRVMDLGDDMAENYVKLQPILRRVIETGSVESFAKRDPNSTRLVLEYTAQVTGKVGMETVVVRVLEEASGILRISDAFVQTR